MAELTFWTRVEEKKESGELSETLHFRYLKLLVTLDRPSIHFWGSKPPAVPSLESSSEKS